MRRILVFVLALVIPTLALGQNQPPIADAGHDRTAILGTMIQLDGTGSYDPDGDSIVYWDWQVIAAPAGAVDPLRDAYTPTPLLIANALGDYVISLAVYDGQYWSVTDFVTVTVAQNQPPVAVIEAAPLSGTAPLTVSFDASKSYDPDGTIGEYDWSFGDGYSNEPVVSHTYTAPGVYRANLLVADNFGVTGEENVEITVLPPANHPPVASPTASPRTGPAPLAVQFAANVTDADSDPLTYAWDFGDGTASTDRNPAHTYTQPGDYTATLTVSDGKAQVSASLPITVSSNLVMQVTSVRLDYTSTFGTLANLNVSADFSGLTPSGEDVIALSIDGVSLFAAPFSSFVLARNAGEFDAGSANPLLYKLRLDNGTRVWLDLRAGTITVVEKKVNLAGISLENGLDVELTMGPAADVYNVRLVTEPSRRYRYDEPRLRAGRGPAPRGR